MIRLNKVLIFNVILLLTSIVLPYRKVAPIVIVLLILIAFLNRKRFSWNYKATKYYLLIALPFLCHLLFVWKEDNLSDFLKSIEKLLSLIIFPFIILGFHKIIKSKYLLNWYPIISILVIIGLAVRFVVTSPNKISNYLNGIDLHEPGYAFSNSFGSHAPAINMHLAFIISVLFFNLYQNFRLRNSFKKQIYYIIIFLFSIVILILINTRLAIVMALVNTVLITLYYNRKSIRKNLINSLIIIAVFSSGVFTYTTINPAFKTKLTTITFAHMDKVGRLDEVENPEVNIFNALVTRVSIWKTTLDLGKQNYLTGVGASKSREKLIEAYKETNQNFLFKYKFPVHNQYLDYFLKFGILGLICVLIYVLNILYIGIKTQNILAICFFIIFFSANLVDDFLIRFDGIGFSAFWLSFFSIKLLRYNK